MLALTDEALVRICVAATAIRPDERSAWLAGLASRLEPAPTTSHGARYTRAWRERGRNGEVLLRVIVDEAVFAVAAVERACSIHCWPMIGAR